MLLASYASREHYADHLEPVVAALRQRGVHVAAYTSSLDVWGAGKQLTARTANAQFPILVASGSDARRFRNRPVIYLEHGAGQQYEGRPFGYAGGPGLEHVVAFLSPNAATADAWHASYPRARAFVIGCPKLDRHHAAMPAASYRHSADRPPTVAITFHWDCPVAPEARGAFDHYSLRLRELAWWCAEHRVELVGHAHPRAWSKLGPAYRKYGILTMRGGHSVLDQADVLVADNTSLMYEFASLDKPVVVMNAPWYRRDVEHGLRFWSHVPGIQIDGPDRLIAAVRGAVAHPEVGARLRKRATRAVYAHTDGHAADRAADAILGVLNA